VDICLQVVERMPQCAAKLLGSLPAGMERGGVLSGAHTTWKDYSYLYYKKCLEVLLSKSKGRMILPR
jgi:hypothetical protein